jgi:hypothetical protein
MSPGYPVRDFVLLAIIRRTRREGPAADDVPSLISRANALFRAGQKRALGF